MNNLNLKAIKNKSGLKENTLLLKFFSPSDNLEMDLMELERDISFKLNASLKKEFLDKESSRIEFFPSNNLPSKVILIKQKESKKSNVDFYRNLLSEVISGSNKKIIKNFMVDVNYSNDLDKYFGSEEYFYQTICEGVFYGLYKFDKYKSEKKKPEKVNVSIVNTNIAAVKKAINSASIVCKAVNFARDLVNEPAMSLPPQELAKRTKAELTKAGVKVQILNKNELVKRKMGAVLAVGQGSDNPPNMIILTYKPKVKAKKKIVLVGKGVTFDTGGYSIKTENYMLGMEADMGGAAGVIGATLAIAEAKLPVEIITIVPAVENCISGNAYKPGDIVKTASGKSILVMNTDAEGRIILADALELASKQKADLIVDMATLTGACEVALGGLAGGMFTQNKNIREEFSKVADKSFERVWPLPMWDDYNEYLKTDIADIKNLGIRYGGAITAGKFLEHFVEEKDKWVHFDIPSPSPENKLKNYQKKYSSAYGVRLLFEYAKSL